jgi:hypothetical protein
LSTPWRLEQSTDQEAANPAAAEGERGNFQSRSAKPALLRAQCPASPLPPVADRAQCHARPLRQIVKCLPRVPQGGARLTLTSQDFQTSLAPKLRSGSMSAVKRPVGVALMPPARGRKVPEPGLAMSRPASTMISPRRITVSGHPTSVRPA